MSAALAALGIEGFARPALLWLAPLLIGLWWLARRRSPPPALEWPGPLAQDAALCGRDLAHSAAGWLRAAALLALVLDLGLSVLEKRLVPAGLRAG